VVKMSRVNAILRFEGMTISYVFDALPSESF
jgi:hypothetical protein